MEYVGADDAVCDDRAFAVNGSGRITSSGGALVLSGGAGTVTPGVNVLYLGGNAQNCVMNNITNGVGTLKVVKEGAGDWSLGGNLDFTGGIHVKAGGLAIGNDYQVGNYSYYRLTIREKNMSGSGNSYFTIGRLALFNEDGEVQNVNLSYNPDANSKGGRSLLEPGQFAYTFTAGNLSPNGFFNHKDSDGVHIDMPMYNATNIFAALDANVEAFARFRHVSKEGTSWWPGLDGGADWPSIDFRLPAGTGKIVSYDIGARYGSAAKTDATKTAAKKNWMDIVGSWTLYGSVDGENWTELSSVTSNDLRGVATADCSWLYDGVSYKTEEGWRRETSGWTIASRPAGGHEVAVSQFVGGMGKVAVDAGATLRAKGDYTIDELELGTENGTFDGFAFASAGTLHANVSEVSGPLDLNAVFVNCTGLSNLKNWRVVSDGGILHVIEIGEDGVKVATCGLRVLVR